MHCLAAPCSKSSEISLAIVRVLDLLDIETDLPHRWREAKRNRGPHSLLPYIQRSTLLNPKEQGRPESEARREIEQRAYCT
jgi:hypothetical protein